MTLFGPSIGGGLELLRTPPEKLKKLSWQAQWDFKRQLRHQCIRQAWRLYAASGRPVRGLLDLVVGRAALDYAQACGYEESDHFIEVDMDQARAENEWRTCFGFHLEDRIELIQREIRADPSLFAMGWRVYLFEQCKKQWEDYRDHINADPLARETVRVVQEATGRSPHLENCAKLDMELLIAEIVVSSIEGELGVKLVRAIGAEDRYGDPTFVTFSVEEPELISIERIADA